MVQGKTTTAAQRREWVRPTIVMKPLQETRSGVGTQSDALADLQS